MEILQIMGVLFSLIIVSKLLKFICPKKYNWNNCPNDHDTMSRSGSKYCDKCNNEL